MRQSVRMPQFGESSAEATVVAWLVNPGDMVSSEQELVEVQTEKSLLTVAAPASGRLSEQCAEPGKKLAVGDILAYIEVLSDEPAAKGQAPAPASNGSHAPAHAGAHATSHAGTNGERTTSPVPAGVHDIGTAPKARARTLTSPRRRPQLDGSRNDGRAAVRAGTGDAAFISPRVRSLLVESGLKVSDLATMKGSGADGRVTAEDIQHYLSQGEAMSSVRQAVANAMARSWTRPLATVARNVRMDALLAHRRTIEGRPSATIYAMRALALALKEGNPLACRLFGNRLLTPAHVDLAVAVEIDDGVLTPVVRKVEELDLPKLTQVVEEVISKARDGRVSDAGDAVAAVSNYGTFGLTWATPIPLPGQGLILGLGAVRAAPDWNPATKSWDRIREAEFTVTFDHRIADGGAAARLLNALAELIEHPERLVRKDG